MDLVSLFSIVITFLTQGHLIQQLTYIRKKNGILRGLFECGPVVHIPENKIEKNLIKKLKIF